MKKTLSLLFAFMISVTMISPTLLAEDASVSVPPTDINNPLPVPIPASTEIKHAIPDSVNPSERVIIGNDDTRFWIDDTTVWPYRGVVAVFSSWNNGQSYFQSSGAVVNGNTVITAGHSIFNSSRGGKANKVLVIPAFNGNNYPYGEFEAKDWKTASGFSPNSATDYAVIKTNDNLSSYVGSLGMSTMSNPVGTSVEVVGYPGSKGGEMWGSYSKVISKTTPTRLYYDCDTEPGNSGGPVMLDNGQIVAIHTSGYSSSTTGAGVNNAGVRLTSSVINWIKSNF